VATQQLLRPSRGEVRGRDTRRADSLVQIISLLGARRREMKASASERLRLLDERAAASESRQIRLDVRLASIEGRLRQGERLRQQLEILRPRADPPPNNARLRQLGSVLMYVGGLLVVWVVLLQLGLAVGLT
jgi:hypothetical protein